MTAPILTPDELLTTTRAVRRRLDLTRPVPMQLVRECLDIALQAPTGSNRQNWHWIVVTDTTMRAAIGEVYRRSAHEYLASPGSAAGLFADDSARSEVQQRVGASVAFLADRIAEVPVMVIPCLRLKTEGFPPGSQADIWGSVLPAAWSYMLAARARGLGTVWTTLHLDYESEVAQLLGLPEHVHQAALIPTAYCVGDRFRPAPRQPLDEVLHIDRW